jgi:hypothetical protein
MRRLSEIDLARIAPLPQEEKLYRLRRVKAGFPPHSYRPLRSTLGDILNLQLELFGTETSSTPWAQVAADITKRSNGESEAEFNLAVAESLYNFGNKHGVRSCRKPIAPWAGGYGQALSYLLVEFLHYFGGAGLLRLR